MPLSQDQYLQTVDTLSAPTLIFESKKIILHDMNWFGQTFNNWRTF